MPSVVNVDGGTFTQKVVFSNYTELNERNLDEHVHGTFTAAVTGDPLSSVAPITWTHGIGKIVIVVNAGSDFAGTITITGTQVDRNTGVETGAATEDITIDALTTDDSDTDAEGNTRHAFTGAYITSNWYKGSVTASTTDVTLTDVDIWAVSFEQVNDTPQLELETFNISFDVLNTAAWFYAYLYTIVVTAATKKCTIVRSASLALDVGDSEVVPYRLRRGNLGVSLDGSKDGFWYELFYGPNNQRYFADITIDVWFALTLSID